MTERVDAFFRAMDVRLPAFWRFESDSIYGKIYQHTLAPLRVIISEWHHPGEKEWIHFSMSHRERIPSWEEFTGAKSHFLGDVYAYQILPPKAKYVNINARVLHLFHCLDGDPLPDFTKGMNSL